jgi:hypothetical protein
MGIIELDKTMPTLRGEERATGLSLISQFTRTGSLSKRQAAMAYALARSTQDIQQPGKTS